MRYYRLPLLTCVAFTGCALSAAAQQVPSAAESQRIDPASRAETLLPSTSQTITLPDTDVSAQQPPEGFDQVRFVLKDISIVGNTTYAPDALALFYNDLIGNEVTLADVWHVAQSITRTYHEDQYFLSKAFLPQQEIDSGVVTIQIIEGYVSEVVVEDAAKNYVVDGYIERIKAMKPVHAARLESLILRLNDLEGMTFFGALGAASNPQPGAVRLTLSHAKALPAGNVTINNYGSRFLGPVQASAAYRAAIAPLHQVTVTGALSVPPEELQYGGLRYQTTIYPNLTLSASGSYIASEPGASISAQQFNSDTTNLSVTLGYQAIRQRQENLSFSLALTGQNTNGDIFGDTPFTRDRIRAVRASLAYDVADRFHGVTAINARVSQGLDVLNASDSGELTLSRADAVPDFTKFDATISRRQRLSDAWQLQAVLRGQYAEDGLFSAEEFGYGGASGIGRAYDPSEVTGDHGVAGSLEAYYYGIQYDEAADIAQFVPYAFYDVGKVWQKQSADDDMSGSSAGGGVRISYPPKNVYTDIAVAFPLTKEVETPQLGHGDHPRLLIELGWGF